MDSKTSKSDWVCSGKKPKAPKARKGTKVFKSKKELADELKRRNISFANCSWKRHGSRITVIADTPEDSESRASVDEKVWFRMQNMISRKANENGLPRPAEFDASAPTRGVWFSRVTVHNDQIVGPVSCPSFLSAAALRSSKSFPLSESQWKQIDNYDLTKEAILVSWGTYESRLTAPGLPDCVRRWKDIAVVVWFWRNWEAKQEETRKLQELEYKKPACCDDCRAKLRKCGFCGAKVKTMKRCSRCNVKYYCTDKCQEQDWPNHKARCAT